MTRNAPYIHLSHDSILELWRTFPNGVGPVRTQKANMLGSQNIIFEYRTYEDSTHVIFSDDSKNWLPWQLKQLK